MTCDKYVEELDLLQNIYECFALLFIASDKIKAEADSEIDDLTLRQLMVLVTVFYIDPDEPNIINIANRLGTSKQNITRIVSSLIKSGYLLRTPSITDKRSVHVTLTDKGLDAISDNFIKSNNFLLEVFQDFTRSDIKVLFNLLKKLASYKSPIEMPIKIQNNDYMMAKEKLVNILRESKIFKTK